MRPAKQLDLDWEEPRLGSPLSEAETEWIRLGTGDYRRASWALFLAGLASFALIYGVQPLLPEFARAFDISPAEASLALSLSTSTMGIAILASAVFAALVSRRSMMFASMVAGALLNVVAALSQDWTILVTARALEGLVLGGVPAVAMAYLAEEIDPAHLGRAMGLYVAGTAFGGMMGRVGVGVLTEFTSWQVAMGTLGLLCLACALGFYCLLPASRNFRPSRGTTLSEHARKWAGLLRNRRLLTLFVIGFLSTSVFVTLFNYVTFHLSAAPFGMGQGAISFIFLTYIAGIASSSLGGLLADRFNRRLVIAFGFVIALAGIVLTLSPMLPIVILGISLLTAGFFVAHSATSGAVGANAGDAKGHASSLYLFFYYMGSSITGSVGGLAFEHGGWMGVVSLTAFCAVLAFWLALSLKGPAEAMER
jgi:YNFM family putative membrane transporter